MFHCSAEDAHPPSAGQRLFMSRPIIVLKLGVAGSDTPRTVRVTGTVCDRPPVAVTERVAWYVPAGSSGGTSTSIHAARFSPAGTLTGNAFRVSP